MIIAYVICGAAAAGGGWLFHHWFGDGTRKSKVREEALKARLY